MFRKLPNILVLASLPRVPSEASKHLVKNYNPAEHELLVLDSACGLEFVWRDAHRGGTATIPMGENVQYVALMFRYKEVLRSSKTAWQHLKHQMQNRRHNGIGKPPWEERWRDLKIADHLIDDEESNNTKILRMLGTIRLAWQARYGNPTFCHHWQNPRSRPEGTSQLEIVQGMTKLILPRWESADVNLPHTAKYGNGKLGPWIA